MIHVRFDPAELADAQKAWWDGWYERASQATRAAIQAWEESKDKSQITFDPEIWGELKRWLLENRFNWKCAYCERSLSRDYPPAEHYRPKGGVKVRGRQKVTTEDEYGQQIEHPGYFWLAYHWKNLVPSCDRCNSGEGKQNQFPVQEQHKMVRQLTPEETAALGDSPYRSPNREDIWYLQPDELDELEQPLLLHPYGEDDNDPRRHLCFGEAGVEAPREVADGVLSPKGLNSIGVFRLDQPELRRERYRAQRDALKTFLSAYAAELADQQTLAAAEENVWSRMDLAEIREGSVEYSAAALDFIELYYTTLASGGV